MINQITIQWEGPFTAKEIREKNDDTDFGIYQVYGNHRIASIPNAKKQR